MSPTTSESRSEAGTLAAWPALPTPAEVRSLLGAWARRRWAIPRDLFSDRISVRDATVARLVVTRLLERRSESPVAAWGELPDLPSYTELAAVPSPCEGWSEARWEGIREGSARVIDCPGCQAAGELPCRGCDGAGTIPCLRRQGCRVCSGRGWTSEVAQGAGARLVSCQNCHGAGTTICDRCRGSGVRACPECGGGGRLRCQRCAGRRVYATYTRGLVACELDVHEVELGDAERLGRDARRHYRSLGVVTEAPPAIPGLPDEVKARIEHELGERVPGLLRCKVEVQALPAVEVSYQRGGELRRAWLVGEEREVHAPGARLAWLGRLRREGGR